VREGGGGGGRKVDGEKGRKGRKKRAEEKGERRRGWIGRGAHTRAVKNSKSSRNTHLSKRSREGLAEVEGGITCSCSEFRTGKFL
jgi:hypothetical protein